MASSTEPKPPVRLGEFWNLSPSYGHLYIPTLPWLFFSMPVKSYFMRCLVLWSFPGVFCSMSLMFLFNHYGQVERFFFRCATYKFMVGCIHVYLQAELQQASANFTIGTRWTFTCGFIRLVSAISTWYASLKCLKFWCVDFLVDSLFGIETCSYLRLQL